MTSDKLQRFSGETFRSSFFFLVSDKKNDSVLKLITLSQTMEKWHYLFSHNKE